MKASLKFDLNDPNEYVIHLRCIKSLDLALALLEVETVIKKLEHLQEINPNTEMDVIDFLKNEFAEILSQKNISLQELLG